ncbi:hypothetical protein OA92_20240 [Marinomonas sp. SBI22]|uniref:DUF2986 domain-containing protein n=1 Tax=unclassified Marinomonas TaxID=196814 RepID=UPI0007AEEA35|nr:MULTISPECIES: DUF2986 domain-containing protein [unclassified Marinomonas]KZM39232.1 hypothetical protein OA92_20240 [Marinomonas sp. SBI22]KZM40221.1 hypothetical protein OA91_20620 [Marinomonas sp. SBI8L]
MNRRKKIKSILTKKEKMANRHNNLNKKPKYISKADRAKLEAEESLATSESSEESISPVQETTQSDR